jgi:hypothetical protein
MVSVIRRNSRIPPCLSEEDMMQTVRAFVIGAALVGLAMSGEPAPAQQKSLKDMLTGTWSITSVFDQYENGEKKDNWGGGVKGQFIFGSDGRYSQIIIGAPVASMKSDDPRKPDSPVVVYFGTYTVDEAGKKIVAKAEAAGYSPRIGSPSAFTVSGSGDTLTLVGVTRKDQHGTFTPNLEIKRAK